MKAYDLSRETRGHFERTGKFDQGDVGGDYGKAVAHNPHVF